MNRDEDVEQCIKAEMKTLYPEEYERVYGPDNDSIERHNTFKKGPFSEWSGRNNPRSQLDGWGPVDPIHKSIFVHIPKTAGMSIATELGMSCKQCHNSARSIKNILYEYHFGKKIWLDYFKFSFVRNPWSRVISHICFLAGTFKVEVNPSEFLMQWMAHGQIQVKDKFTERISHMLRCNQLDFLSESEPEEGKLLVDFVGKFENLQQDFDHVCNQIGIPTRKLPYVNETKKYKHYTEYYNKETKEFISNMYTKDIERFNYEFEN
jgi:chondroitin 4-sulfotransferase 11